MSLSETLDASSDGRESAGAAVPRAGPPRRTRRLLAVAAVLAVVLVAGAVLFRHALIGIALQRGLSLATGYDVRFGEHRLGREHGALFDVHVTKNGDPVFDAARLDVTYQLRDIFPGGQHRYGFASIAVTGAVISIVRHADGSYNFTAGGSSAAAPGPTRTAAAPYFFTLRVRDGAIRLIDRAPAAPDLAEQEINRVTLDAGVKSDARTTAAVSGVLIGKRSAGAPMQRWPLAAKSIVDYDRGFALHRLRAGALPLRGMLGFLLHSDTFRVEDGVLNAVDVKAYAVNIAAGRAFAYRLGGGAELAGARLAIRPLLQPADGVRGRLELVDDGLWTRRVDGNLGGVAFTARGGIYDVAQPTFRLGIAADGDIAALRGLFAFSVHQPVSGGAHIETLLESTIGDPLVRTAFRAPRVAYGAFPLRDARGLAVYYGGAVVLDGVRGTYGASTLTLGGRILVAREVADTAIAIGANARGRDLPYAENVAPEATVAAVALVTGEAQYRARGAIEAVGGGVSGSGFFRVDERGVGEFGPFSFARADGSSVVGALRLERPISQSAGWISARRYRVDVPNAGAVFPGANVPGFPPIAGVIDGSFAGAGTPTSFGITGSARGRDLRIAQYPLGTGSAVLGGTLDDVRIGDVRIAGPLGRFAGAGVVRDGTLALRGEYDGTLESLAPVTGERDARGALHGPVAATVGDDGVVIQTAGARLTNGYVRGVAVDAASGTIAIRKNVLHVIAAGANIGGGHAVAEEADGTIALSAPDVPSRALRGTGIPLEAGDVSIFGRADVRGRAPRFDGTVAVSHGRAAGYAVAGDAHVSVADTRAVVSDGSGALGATYGTFGGTVGGLGRGALQYDLAAGIPLGDVARLSRDMHLPVAWLEGSFDARLRVRGSGARPAVAGTVNAPEGSYNGLAFHDAHAKVALDAFGVSAHDGALTVGSTRAAVDASAARGAFSVAVRSNAADLADFDDYFDESETLAGKGRLDVAFRTDGRRITTRGNVDVRDLRYRRFPFGETQATWSMDRGAVRAQAKVNGAAGTLAAAGTIVPRGGDPLAAFAAARYDGSAALARIDIGTWLPAFGIQAPILGLVDARVNVAGRFPALGVAGDATLRNGSIGGFAVRSASLRAASSGNRIAIRESSADLGFANLTATGTLGYGGTAPVALDLRATAADAGRALHALVPATRNVDVAGALQAGVRVTGSLNQPKLDGGFAITAARYRSLAFPRIVGVVGAHGDAVTLRDTEVDLAKGRAFVAGDLPLQLMPFGIGPPGAPLSFDVTASGVDLAQFSPLLPEGTKLGGTVDGRFGVEGDVAHPRLLGSLTLAGGSYVSPFERAPIQHVDAQLAFGGTSVALQAFHADVGTGTLDGSGRLDLPFAQGARTGYAVNLRANGAQLDFPAYGRGKVNGDLRLTSTAQRPSIAGDVALSDAVIPFAAIFRSGGGGGEGGGPPALDPGFNIHAVAGRNVRVRSAIIDIGATGAVDLRGTLTQPRLAGEFRSTGGTFSTYNHLFRVQSATVTFDPSAGIVPDIDLRATTHVTNPDPDPTRNIAGSADVTVNVTGPADGFTTTLTSQPAYSDAQIAGLLLDVPALLGAVNFNQGQGGTLLRGAPGESNVLLPPGVSPEKTGAISLNQEVFSLLSGQFTQRALTPIEQTFERILGVSDLAFTIDYGGGIGYSLRRRLGAHDFYALLSQTLSYPERTNVGFELHPDAVTSVNFAYFRANGVTSLITTLTPGYTTFTSRHTSFQPLGDRTGFTFTITRRYP